LPPHGRVPFYASAVQELQAFGIRFCEITLHVGHATFLPIRSEDVRQHTLWPERFSVCEETAEAVRKAKREGRRVVAVGTTVVRCLESIAGDAGEIRPKEDGPVCSSCPAIDFGCGCPCHEFPSSPELFARAGVCFCRPGQDSRAYREAVQRNTVFTVTAIACSSSEQSCGVRFFLYPGSRWDSRTSMRPAHHRARYGGHAGLHAGWARMGSVKACSTEDLLENGVAMILANTYHLYLRPAPGRAQTRGLHRFICWPRPILTDSGGYQILSLGR